MDTICIKFMLNGVFVVHRVGFAVITNRTGDERSSGSGRGQALNYEITLLERLNLPMELVRNAMASQSYDNAVFHDHVPQYVRDLYSLPQFHLAIRDTNHNINIAMEKTYASDPNFKIFIRAHQYIINQYSHGSNLLLSGKEISANEGVVWLALALLSITKWTEHQNRSLDGVLTNIRSVQTVHSDRRKETHQTCYCVSGL